MYVFLATSQTTTKKHHKTFIATGVAEFLIYRGTTGCRVVGVQSFVMTEQRATWADGSVL
jgi:hypothetical protein